MKNNRVVMVPAIIVTIVCVGLIIFSFFSTLGGEKEIILGHKGEDQFRGLFKNFGNLTILFGTISYSWFIFKKNLKSRFKWLRTIGKRIFSLHPYVGGASLGFAVLHGVYFITDIGDKSYFTGIASILLLFTIVGYGWAIKRVRNKYIKKTHFVLSNIWPVAILLHGGGLVIFMAVFLGFLFVLFKWMENRKVLKATNH